MNKKRLKTGLLAIASISLTLLASISQNTWFNWTKNALSDLGASTATNPWIFNYGLIITSLLGITYFSKLRKKKQNNITRVGLILLIIDFLFLTLIGVFPKDSSLHTPISLAFFLLLLIGATTYSIGKTKINKKKGLSLILSITTAFFLALLSLHYFNGLAIPETIGIIVLSIVVLTEK